MASTNFLIFDEGKQNMMGDGDYSANTQRARGVTPGIAYPNLHNKLYYQVSVMAKAIADFMVAQGVNASDKDVEQLTDDISTAFTNFVDNKTKEKYLPLSGGTMKGNINASGYNITATKFIGNLQGNATNADEATEAGNINKGYFSEVALPVNDFRNSVLDRDNGFAVRPFRCKFTTNDYPYSPGIAFGAGDTHGYLQIDHTWGEIRVGGGANNKINWSKKIAITESPVFTGTPTAPTPDISDNSTKIATTAFVKSLFTASKQENGWWKDGNTGIIWQWCRESNFWDVSGDNAPLNNKLTLNFPISFNSCLFVLPMLFTNIEEIACNIALISKTNTSATIQVQEWAEVCEQIKVGCIAIGY